MLRMEFRYYYTRAVLPDVEQSLWRHILRSTDDKAFLQLTGLSYGAFEILFGYFSPLLQERREAARQVEAGLELSSRLT